MPYVVYRPNINCLGRSWDTPYIASSTSSLDRIMIADAQSWGWQVRCYESGDSTWKVVVWELKRSWGSEQKQGTLWDAWQEEHWKRIKVREREEKKEKREFERRDKKTKSKLGLGKWTKMIERARKLAPGAGIEYRETQIARGQVFHYHRPHLQKQCSDGGLSAKAPKTIDLDSPRTMSLCGSFTERLKFEPNDTISEPSWPEHSGKSQRSSFVALKGALLDSLPNEHGSPRGSLISWRAALSDTPQSSWESSSKSSSTTSCKKQPK